MRSSPPAISAALLLLAASCAENIHPAQSDARSDDAIADATAPDGDGSVSALDSDSDRDEQPAGDVHDVFTSPDVTCDTALACGPECIACSPAANTTASCVAGACSYECVAGYGDCDSIPGNGCEANLGNDAVHCGSCTTACESPAHAQANCAAGSCAWTCEAGFVEQSGQCVGLPPRLIGPLSTLTSAGARPTFRWSLPGVQDGATVQICRDVACGTIATSFVATGNAATPPRDIPAGVLFWRVLGMVAGEVVSASDVWELIVSPRASGPSGIWGPVFDGNRDGFSDLMVASCKDTGATAFEVFSGSAQGLRDIPDFIFPTNGDPGSCRVIVAGDVNGDGYSDLYVTSVRFSALLPGGPNGVSLDRAQNGIGGVTCDYATYPNCMTAAGDLNGDGYGDIAASSWRQADGPFLQILWGGPDGLSSVDQEILPPPRNTVYGGVVGAPGDVDGDGYADLAVNWGTPHGVMIYRGGPGGLVTPAVTILDQSGYTHNGDALRAVGDVNGDGYPDLGVYSASCLERYYDCPSFDIYFGGPDLYAADRRVLILDPAPAGTNGVRVFPGDAAPAHDIEADGFDDVVFSISIHPNTAQWWILRGAPQLALSAAPAIARMTYVGLGTEGITGAGIGDVDGDGYFDIAVAIQESFSPGDRLLELHRGHPDGIHDAADLAFPGVLSDQDFSPEIVAPR